MTQGLRSEVIRCIGGLNLEGPNLEKRSGQVIAARNFEQKQTGGYRRISGYSKVESTVVPGTGDIAAVARYDSTTYAWRIDGSGEYQLYLANGAGWTLKNLGWFVRFDAGDNEPAEGTTLTAAPGITGVVSRIVVESGAWSSNDAAGFISLRNVAGDWTAVADNTALTDGGATTYCTTNGTATEVVVTGEPRSGVFHNFYGAANDGAFYWCDGTTWVIELRPATGYIAVAPIVCDYVCAHNEHLFFATAAGGNLWCSVPGTPFLVDGASGSIEKSTGAGIAGLASFKGALAAFGDSQTSLLYGQDSTDFQLKRLNGGGALQGQKGGVAVEVEGRLLYVTQTGTLADLAATDTYGNFDSNTVAPDIGDNMVTRRGLVTTVCRRPDKGQVRIFYSDGGALFFTFFAGQLIGVMPQKYPLAVKCYATNADSSLDDGEVAVFGSTDGYVYRADNTGEFDGEAIVSYLLFPFWHMGSPSQKKRWRTLFVEGGADGNGATLRVKQSYDLSNSFSGTMIDQEFEGGNAGIWGSALWGEFYFGGSYGADLGYELTGTSKTMSVLLYNDGTDADFGAMSIDNLIVNYTMRGAARE